MRRTIIFFVATVFLCFSAVASGKQTSPATISSQTGNPNSAEPELDCSRNSGAPNETGKTAKLDQRQPQAQPDPVSESEIADDAPAAVHLEQDLKFIEKRQSELAQCVLAIDMTLPARDSQG